MFALEDKDEVAKYQRDGVGIVVNYAGDLTFKKNGLSITVPADIWQDFCALLEEETERLDRENYEQFKKLFGSKR